MRDNREMTWPKWIILILYFFFLCVILFFRRIPAGLDFVQYPYCKRILDNTNLIPFDTILYQIHDITHDSGYFEYLAILNLSANIMMFIPMGVIIPILWKKCETIMGCLFRGGVMILVIELIQLFTLLGSFDVDDIILNLSGIALGFLFHRAYHCFLQ